MSYHRWIYLIIAGLLVWGLFHAIGAYTFNWNPWRAVVVFGCMVAFVAFWLAMLGLRESRKEREVYEREKRERNRV